jgi:hypothetical protein
MSPTLSHLRSSQPIVTQAEKLVCALDSNTGQCKSLKRG